MKNVLLIGDSIRVTYDKYVAMAMEGEAKVYYPEENCRFSAYVLRHFPDWARMLPAGEKIDVVHWNAGLWDCLLLYDGIKHTDIESYKNNLDRTCRIMKMMYPDAVFIFATSTHIQEDKYPPVGYRRLCKDVEEYNAAAVEVVTRHGHIVNDLNKVSKTLPLSAFSDMTHYYTKEGTRALTDAVLKVISENSGIGYKPLDYDALFADETNIVGL